jgi:hypothetical protein
LFKKLLKQTDLEQNDIAYIVGTGYGRVALEFGVVQRDVEQVGHQPELARHERSTAEPRPRVIEAAASGRDPGQ